LVRIAPQTRAHSSGARGFVANFDRQRGPFDKSARVCGGAQSRFVTRPEQFGVGTRCLPIHLNRVQIAALTFFARLLVSPMDWVGRELSVAAGSGAVTSAVLISPVIDDNWWDLTLPAVLGATVGLLVGFVAVVGGKYALKTAVPWPPSGRKQWGHRFAMCTAAVVTLFVSGLLVWASASSAMVASDSAEPPIQLMVTITLTAISYVFAYFLAPEVK
jgi:hypothetical protein